MASEAHPTINSEAATVLGDQILSESAFTATIAAPIERVDIARWLFSLPNDEYKRCCPPEHISAGVTSTDDGTPMSINVEMIGTSLMIQQYVAEVHRPDHCHMVSISDVFGGGGRTRLQIIWDLSVSKIDDDRCEYRNSVTAHPTEEFLAFIDEAGQSFEEAKDLREKAGGAHNRKETPLFAKSLERLASGS